MSADTINCRNIQSGFVVYDWPLADWDLHDDLYKAEWEVLASEVAPEAPVEPEAPAEQTAPAE